MHKSILIDRIKTLTAPLEPEQFDHATRLASLEGIKCVAFDFYGTMFVSGVGDIGVDEEQKEAYKRIFEGALADAGFQAAHPSPGQTGLQQFREVIDRQIEEQKEEGVEYPEPDIVTVWEEVLAALVQLNFLEGPITRKQAIRFAVEFEFRANNIWPVPDLEEVLNELLQGGFALGIISNSQFYTPLAFEALIGNSTDAFGFDPDLQIWSYRHGLKKPSLEFYRKFTGQLEQKSIAAEEVLYVGNDLFKDIIPAKKLNMRTALYVGDRRSLRHEAQDLTHAGHRPDIIIDDLRQVPECLPS